MGADSPIPVGEADLPEPDLERYGADVHDARWREGWEAAEEAFLAAGWVPPSRVGERPI